MKKFSVPIELLGCFKSLPKSCIKHKKISHGLPHVSELILLCSGCNNYIMSSGKYAFRVVLLILSTVFHKLDSEAQFWNVYMYLRSFLLKLVRYVKICITCHKWIYIDLRNVWPEWCWLNSAEWESRLPCLVIHSSINVPYQYPLTLLLFHFSSVYYCR